MKKMLYYIAESSKTDLFTTTIIKRCDNYDEAVGYCKASVDGWREEGYDAFLNYDENVAETAKVIGCEALDEEFTVIHNYLIFATTAFLGGGTIG